MSQQASGNNTSDEQLLELLGSCYALLKALTKELDIDAEATEVTIAKGDRIAFINLADTIDMCEGFLGLDEDHE